MLTVDLLKSQSELASLPEDALKKIASMSEIDEGTVIGNKIADIYNRLDADIEKASGLKKATSEKTYEFAARAIGEVRKNGGADLQTQLDALKAEKTELEKKIKNGDGDGALKTQLANIEKDLADAKSQVKQWKDKHKEDIEAKEKALLDAQKEAIALRVNHQFDIALASVKYDEKIPKEVRDTYIENAKAALMSEYTPDFIDNGNGGKTMVFKKGEEIQRNKENGLQPWTATELLQNKLSPIIDKGKQATGTGTKPGAPGAANASGSVDLSGVRTKVEATETIGKHLVAQGIARGTNEFNDKMTEITAANKDVIDPLPFKNAV